MNTDKDFAPYQPSLDMKELGFDEECLAIHSFVDGELNFMYVNTFHSNDDVNEKSAAAPLYQQAFRWFREKYGLWQIVPQNTDIDWTYDILPINGIHDYSLIDVFETYEEAELECLKKLIEIVKNNNK
jgi:hypothetical protein